MSKKAFIDSFDRPSIAAHVIKQFGGWTQFKDYAVDVSNFGAAAGFPDFTYYSDTVKFYEANRLQINMLACDLAENIGENVISLISGFNCVDADESEVQQFIFQADMEEALYTQLANAMAWFALEEVAHHFARESEAA